jgi:formylglycine-generating enzyme required for sulfatase activity
VKLFVKVFDFFIRYFKTIFVVLGIYFIIFVSVPGSANSQPSEIYFPPGEFWMGSKENKGRPDEKPRHKVFLDGFYLDKYETTGKEFEQFLEQFPKEHPPVTGWYGKKIRPSLEDSPVIGLTWKRCQKYCQWRGKRLPTEAEWERAATGLNERRYPWGNQPPTLDRANFNKCCFIMKGEVLQPVGSYELGKTSDGVFEMAGNIAEWVFDWYGKDFYSNSPSSNPAGPKTGKYRVIRGGAWNSMSGYLRSQARYGYNDGQDFYGIGCRCAKTEMSSKK